MCSFLPGDLGLPSDCHSLLGTTWLRICVWGKDSDPELCEFGDHLRS